MFYPRSPNVRRQSQRTPYHPAATSVSMLLGALLVVGASSVSAAGAEMKVLRGFVSEETLPGIFTFRRCEGSKLLPRPFLLSDLTFDQALFAGIVEVRKSRQDADRPLYVEFRGDGTDKAVSARKFDRAVGHVESCDGATRDVPADATLHAEGDDPAWRFIARPAGARLEVVGEKPIRYPAAPFASPMVAGATRTYDAWSRDDGGSIRIEVIEQMCAHSGKETAYGARVLARVGSRTFEGCAARY